MPDTDTNTKTLYATGINGKPIAASAIVPGTVLASKIAEIEQKIISTGSYEVVPLTSGANPVPDVPEPKTTVIYLTKESGSSKTDPYTEWIYIAGTPAGTWEVIGETSIDLSGYKTKQTAVGVTGGTLKGVASMSQNANGEVTLTLNDIQDGTTSQKGVVQLEDSHASTATDKAATPKNVKEAYDLAAGKQDPITFDGTYDASSNKAATQSTVSNAIAALDAEETSTDGTNVQVKVTQVDGVVTAVNITADNTANATDVQNLTSGKADKVSSATAGNFAGLDSNGNLTDSGSKASDFKTKQTAVSDPTIPSSGPTTATEFIATISQDANGEISATKRELPTASTNGAGITSLSSAHDSTAENAAATPKAVKDAYDLAASKYTRPSGGITESDLSVTVNASLDLADTALQPVSGATSGNFVGFGSNGAIQDSGSKAADFATAAQGTKAETAVQDVTMAGASVVASNVAVIPAATTPTPSGSGEITGAYGVVQITLMEIGDDDED